MRSVGYGRMSKTQKAGLLFPVSRVAKQMKDRMLAKRIGAGAPIYLAAVMEYMAAEVLELAGNAAKDCKKTRIIPRHIQLAVRGDAQLNDFLKDVIVSQGGVLPCINKHLIMPKRKSNPQPQQTSPNYPAEDESEEY